MLHDEDQCQRVQVQIKTAQNNCFADDNCRTNIGLIIIPERGPSRLARAGLAEAPHPARPAPADEISAPRPAPPSAQGLARANRASPGSRSPGHVPYLFCPGFTGGLGWHARESRAGATRPVVSACRIACLRLRACACRAGIRCGTQRKRAG